ncbi:MAG: VWA domain-containing protein [Acidobacteria bacterium]|nr:VWA domain-containing protein [Acidobacteriota bacterium]
MTDRPTALAVDLSVRADRRLIRADESSRRFIRLRLQAPGTTKGQKRLPVNLAFVLDRSGSMEEEGKIERARKAVLQGIRSLSDRDRFSVVAYDDRIDVVVPSTAATREARKAAAAAVRGIEPRGATDLCEGWLRGCAQVESHLADDAVGRCLLLTDGLANHGITDEADIVRHASDLRDRRVATSTFGLGADFDEKLLHRMAEAGRGNFHFIESAAQIPEFIAGEVGETLHVTARDVALVVETGEGVTLDSLNGYPCRQLDGGEWRVEIGSLFAGQSIDAVLRVVFPGGEIGGMREVGITVVDRDGVLEGARGSLPFHWADEAANRKQDRDRAVDRRVAALTAARAYQEALERNRAGDYAGARRVIQKTAQDISRYAGDDPATLGTLGTLRLQIDEVAREMDSLARKRGYASASGTLSSRPVLRDRDDGATRNFVLMPVSGIRSLVDAAVLPLAAADPELFGDMILDGRLSDADDEAGPDAALTPEEEEDLTVTAVRTVPEARVRLVFTARPLADGRSSHWDEDRRTAVVSLAGLEGTLAECPQALVAAEIVFYGLHLLGPGYEPERIGHVETRGCLFDFSRTPADIAALLEGSDLCPSCRDKLAASELSLDRLLKLAEVIRSLAAGDPAVH